MFRRSKRQNLPFEGKVNFSKDTGLRKLMRAARRGKIPDERMVIIQQAERLAAERVAPRRSDPIGQPSPGELATSAEVS